MDRKREITDLIRAAYSARIAGDLQTLLSYFADDAHFAMNAEALSPPTGSIVGRRALEKAFGALIAAYAIEGWEEIALLVDGDRAAAHWRAKVTVAPGGKADIFDVFDFFVCRGDKIIESRESTDTGKLMSVSAS